MASPNTDPEAGNSTPVTRPAISHALRHTLVAVLGEFLGTTLFLTLAFAGAEAAGSQGPAGSPLPARAVSLLYISVSFGFSLMVNVWIFAPISGAHLNPAVTLAMVLLKKIAPVRAGLYFFAQLVGGILASVIVRFMIPESFSVETTVATGTNLAQGFFIEVILTAELVLAILMLCEPGRSSSVAPLGIGLALFVAELMGVQYTGGSLNPARSFGPCVASGHFVSEHWIYWLGPAFGSVLAVGFFKLYQSVKVEVPISGNGNGDVLAYLQAKDFDRDGL